MMEPSQGSEVSTMDVSTELTNRYVKNNKHAQSQDTGHQRLQQGRESGTGVPGERLLIKECSEAMGD
jgi:hypothetical protein